MKWYERWTLWSMVFVLGFGVYVDLFQDDKLASLQKTDAVLKEAGITSFASGEALKIAVGELSKTLTISVLDSCGIITDGYRHGSVVAIGPDLLLTAGHCIDHTESWIEVQDVRYEIVEQWASEDYDVGFVRIEGVIPYVQLGQMPDLLDEVYLIGSPYEVGLVNSVTKGIISHLDRDIWQWNDLIQTDAEGAPGSSGCPLFDVQGQIVGICVSGAIPGGGVILCVPVVDIRAALETYRAR